MSIVNSRTSLPLRREKVARPLRVLRDPMITRQGLAVLKSLQLLVDLDKLAAGCLLLLLTGCRSRDEIATLGGP